MKYIKILSFNYPISLLSNLIKKCTLNLKSLIYNLSLNPDPKLPISSKSKPIKKYLPKNTPNHPFIIKNRMRYSKDNRNSKNGDKNMRR